MNGILIIAHAPLASALRQCVAHVFTDHPEAVAALDVQPNTPPEETLAQARIMLAQLGTSHALVLAVNITGGSQTGWLGWPCFACARASWAWRSQRWAWPLHPRWPVVRCRLTTS